MRAMAANKETRMNTEENTVTDIVTSFENSWKHTEISDYLITITIFWLHS
jgi:hypothetical protein